jgi:FlaA1/EpsC-like NDP-sugar epimerase
LKQLPSRLSISFDPAVIIPCNNKDEPTTMADASFTPRNILIFGATGTIGSFITKSIVSARSEFNRVAIFTTAPAAGSAKEQFIQELKTKNVEIIVGDIASESDVANAYKGTYTCF